MMKRLLAVLLGIALLGLAPSPLAHAAGTGSMTIKSIVVSGNSVKLNMRAVVASGQGVSLKISDCDTGELGETDRGAFLPDATGTVDFVVNLEAPYMGSNWRFFWGAGATSGEYVNKAAKVNFTCNGNNTTSFTYVPTAVDPCAGKALVQTWSKKTSSGAPKVGKTAKVSRSVASACGKAAKVSFKYTWNVGKKVVSTSTAYKPAAMYKGKTLKFKVVAYKGKNAIGSRAISFGKVKR